MLNKVVIASIFGNKALESLANKLGERLPLLDPHVSTVQLVTPELTQMHVLSVLQQKCQGSYGIC